MAQTATFTQSLSTQSVLRTLGMPFRALWTLMVLLAEANPRMKALERLSRTSDEALAEQGKTRESEIRRIMGLHA
ncbi:hypothetical protein MLD63_00825 (plasmid) [Paracoccus sp. TK19116]|uniref:DUF1127 domain-containing protein n=1 Tax=Paracoccus albicereus TaxID=2922394 RepID=A0ABT1ML02_9RHOB|nr:hypothetical protein [Paracoccus albicereus]MCQ0968977.1 hypothetical protein [Paracoccus albicereus]